MPIGILVKCLPEVVVAIGVALVVAWFLAKSQKTTKKANSKEAWPCVLLAAFCGRGPEVVGSNWQQRRFLDFPRFSLRILYVYFNIG